MAKNNIVENQKVNLIENGTKIKGDIESNGDFRIDGTLIGSIKSKGKIVVGTTGSVEGDISCRNADISGKVKAQVNITELLSLKASADISGDIKTAKLSIEPGAKFSGTCNMGNAPNTAIKFSSQNDEKAKPK
ncbi:MAG: polymer-forming cytoskeletal protein [Bacteroidales bacterium]|nr:polymer-forming cytoskeletal protein [Bacteroidales bacterium]